MPKSNKSEPGPKMYAINIIRNKNGITPLATSLTFDDMLLISII